MSAAQWRETVTLLAFVAMQSVAALVAIVTWYAATSALAGAMP